MENNGSIHVYSLGTGADNPRGQFVFQKCNSSVNLVIWCKFFPIFFHSTAEATKFDLAVNRTMSTQGHHLCKRSPDFRFWRRRFLKVFTINGRGGHLGHVTWTIYTNFPSNFTCNGFDLPSIFRGEDV